MEGRLLDIVIRESTTILELFTSEDEALLGLDEKLHATTETTVVRQPEYRDGKKEVFAGNPPLEIPKVLDLLYKPS